MCPLGRDNFAVVGTIPVSQGPAKGYIPMFGQLAGARWSPIVAGPYQFSSSRFRTVSEAQATQTVQ